MEDIKRKREGGRKEEGEKKQEKERHKFGSYSIHTSKDKSISEIGN